MRCTCGHIDDEHGHDDEHPGSTSCTVEGCDCIAFEADEDLEDDDL